MELMEQRPIFFCQLDNVTDQALIEKNTSAFDFWEVVFEPNSEAVIHLQITSKEIIVSGEESTFPVNNNLAEVLHLISPLDMSYINELCGDDETEKEEMLELFKTELSLNLKALQTAFTQQDFDQVKFFAHKLVSKIVVLSIPIYDDCKYVENNTAANDTTAFKTAYKKVIMHCYIKLWQFS